MWMNRVDLPSAAGDCANHPAGGGRVSSGRQGTHSTSHHYLALLPSLRPQHDELTYMCVHPCSQVVAGETAGPRNEKATLTTLSNCIKSRLATYTTSMEEDLGSLDKLERLLEDLASQQKKAATGSDGKEGNGAMVDRLTALMDTTRRRVHALRVCLDDKVVFVQAATHVQERLRKVEEEGVQGP